MTMAANYFIGWDVGGWNCEKNKDSRDAIVVIDENKQVVGRPWRGNLRGTIAACKTATEWVQGVFALCRADAPQVNSVVTVAIDTPLGFPADFLGLVQRGQWAEPDRDSGNNGYLYRRTERLLHAKGKTPLSAIKDMIGSQATKGMHAVAKFAPRRRGCGVWWDGGGFIAIETYPGACRETSVIKEQLGGLPTLQPQDCQDALVCALIARLFSRSPEILQPPTDDVIQSEGWIWLPRESYAKNAG